MYVLGGQFKKSPNCAFIPNFFGNRQPSRHPALICSVGTLHTVTRPPACFLSRLAQRVVAKRCYFYTETRKLNVLHFLREHGNHTRWQHQNKRFHKPHLSPLRRVRMRSHAQKHTHQKREKSQSESTREGRERKRTSVLAQRSHISAASALQ